MTTWIKALCMGGLVVALLPTLARAHNGAVALAYPVEGITIDGDLSDWPADVISYPIALPVFKDKPKNKADLQAFFWIGHSVRENALYLAVEVEDESTVIDSTGGIERHNLDESLVYVDANHEHEDTPPTFYRLGGHIRDGLGQAASAEVTREAYTHRYEWRINLQHLQDRMQTHAGMVLGLGVALFDSDADSSFSLMAWGRGATKSMHTARLGDVILVGEESGLGWIKGRAVSEAGMPAVRRKVRISSLHSETFWVQTMTDGKGEYSVEVPVGTYLVEPFGRGGNKALRTEVQQDRETRGELVLKAPRGETVWAGQGQSYWRIFSVSDGLPSFTSLDIIEDSKGNLWIGTWGGVTRYDGEEFTTFTTEDGLAHNTVMVLLEDRKGNLWFGTSGGVSRYDGKQFTTFTTKDGLGSNSISLHGIAEDREGNLWFATWGEGVSRYDGEEFRIFTTEDGLVSNEVGTIVKDRKGNLWFGTGRDGVSRYDGKQFTTFTTKDGLVDNRIWYIAEDYEGNLWFGTWNGGVSRFDGEKFTNFTMEDGLASNEVVPILADSEGHMWFGTARGGLTRYDGEMFRSFTEEDGLASNIITTILEDSQGNLWFGTGVWDGTGWGVTRYDGETFTTFTTEDGLPGNAVYSIVEDSKQNLWFGTLDGGVARYDGKQFTTFSTEDGLVNNRVSLLFAKGIYS